RHIGLQTALVQSPRDTVQISSLAPDLFRLRIVRGRNFSERPSWAVNKNDWPAHEIQITQREGEIVLATEKGKLSLNLRNGQWKLCDVNGNVAFEAPVGATGFQVTKAGVTLNLTDNQSIF